MNEFQSKLYADLMGLVASNEAFYFQDFDRDNKLYRIFNYRLASYTDFQKPGALECRGIMFEVNPKWVDVAGEKVKVFEVIRLASLPMEKFFNLNENPSTMDLDLSTVVAIEEKADGSLMSTYTHDGELFLKSKGSLYSDQAIAAMKWLNNEPLRLKKALHFLTDKGLTVNLEWCSPEHRIVLGYVKPALKVLNIRDNLDGSYVSARGLFDEVNLVKVVNTDDPVAFVNAIPAMVDVEGFVLVLESGQRVKVKCEWYLSLHHAKDSVNNPRRLFECILDEGVDDLRSMFHADVVAMLIIDQMQEKVTHIYNEMVKTVEAYYEANKALTRKEYAIKGQQELVHMNFKLAMDKYTGKVPNYKEYLKSKWKELGLKDSSVDQTDE